MAAKEQEETPSAAPPKEKVLLHWSAPSRPFKRRSREFYVTLISVSVLVGIILFLVEGIMPVLLLISLLFLFYVMSTVEPDSIEYSITSFGIKVGDELTPWMHFGRFWYVDRFGATLLVVQTDMFPGRREYILGSVSKDEVTKALSEYLVFEEASPSGLDKIAHWVSKKMPE